MNNAAEQVLRAVAIGRNKAKSAFMRSLRSRPVLTPSPAATQRVPLAGLKYPAPVLNPGKAFAIGLNYLDHAAESNFEPPKHPVIFQRYRSSWVAHDDPLVRPRVSTQFDYEAELVAVIGRGGRYISKSAPSSVSRATPFSTTVRSAITSYGPISG